MSDNPRQDADYERQILDALDALADSVRTVHSMARGGEYDDTRLWEVDRIVQGLRARFDEEAP